MFRWAKCFVFLDSLLLSHFGLSALYWPCLPAWHRSTAVQSAFPYMVMLTVVQLPQKTRSHTPTPLSYLWLIYVIKHPERFGLAWVPVFCLWSSRTGTCWPQCRQPGTRWSAAWEQFDNYFTYFVRWYSEDIFWTHAQKYFSLLIWIHFKKKLRQKISWLGPLISVISGTIPL